MFPLCHRHVGGLGVWREAAPCRGSRGVRCGPAWFPSTPPRGWCPLVLPFLVLPAGSGAAAGCLLLLRPGMPPCPAPGRGGSCGLWRCGAVGAGGEAALSSQPPARPGRILRALQAVAGCPGSLCEGLPVVPRHSPLFPSGGRRGCEWHETGTFLCSQPVLLFRLWCVWPGPMESFESPLFQVCKRL